MMIFVANVIPPFLLVIPAQAGIHRIDSMDSGLRRSDDAVFCNAVAERHPFHRPNKSGYDGVVGLDKIGKNKHVRN